MGKTETSAVHNERKLGEKLLASLVEVREKIDRLLRIKEEESQTEEADISQNDSVYIDSRVEKVKSFIEKNYNNPMLLEDLAEMICLCPKYLSKLFKENTGKTFNRYKAEVRIEKAKELLKDAAYSVEQVAEEVGYPTPSLFRKVFKKIIKLTPMEYRKAGKTST
jgi:YesN/AraC family two-component response regulator